MNVVLPPGIAKFGMSNAKIAQMNVSGPMLTLPTENFIVSEKTFWKLPMDAPQPALVSKDVKAGRLLENISTFWLPVVNFGLH